MRYHRSHPKLVLHQTNVMLCCWDYKGILLYGLLKEYETVDAAHYCSLLDVLNLEIQRKRPSLAIKKGVILHHDNDRPYEA
ncbi:hypothetical protein TNCV_3773541 [Trichonephila clavipes]|nr:hypothetical protein TNCV_3773541 [Trichonephila clavipes]